MSYKNWQSDQKPKLKPIWAQRVAIFKTNGTTISVTLKENGTVGTKYVWKLKITILIINLDWEIVWHMGKTENHQSICSNWIQEKISIAKTDKNLVKINGINSFILAFT